MLFCGASQYFNLEACPNPENEYLIQLPPPRQSPTGYTLTRMAELAATVQLLFFGEREYSRVEEKPVEVGTTRKSFFSSSHVVSCTCRSISNSRAIQFKERNYLWKILKNYNEATIFSNISLLKSYISKVVRINFH